MIDELVGHMADILKELDGVVALRQTVEGTGPHLFKTGDDLSQLALTPRYPLASDVSMLQKRFPEASFGIVVAWMASPTGVDVTWYRR